MLRHYVILAIRNFQRHKSSFFINLIGLSTGLACALLIFLWAYDEMHMDKFHEKDAQLFRVLEHQKYAEEIMTTHSTPGPLAAALKADIPEIDLAATIFWSRTHTLFVGEKNFKIRGRFVGADFLQMMSFPLIEGNPVEAMKDPNAAVISEEVAIKLFGSAEAAMGKMIDVDHESERMVSAVMKKIPANSTLKFDLLLSFEKFQKEQDWLDSWESNSPATYVCLIPGADHEEVSKKIAGYIKRHYEQTNVTLFLKPFSEAYLYGRYENGVLTGGRIEYVRLFGMIAIFILVIACINFMNLSTARASRRAKEVGVKKAIGAGRGSLIAQYLSESTIVASVSLLLALGLVQLFLPQFNLITEKQVSLAWSPQLALVLLGITLLTGLLAGSYPAFYLSSFAPVAVLKSSIKSSFGELWARRGLVVFQFTLSIILIVAVIVVYQQIQFVQSKNLGYQKDNLIKMGSDGQIYEKMDAFLAEVKKIPGIVNASSMGHSMVGRQNNTSGLQWEGKDPEERILFENMGSNYDLMETIGVELVDGRFFSKDFGADSSKIIFNEAAIEVMGLADPIGKTIRLWEEYDLEIIGVVKDFHFQSLHEPVNPAFFWLRPENTWTVMARLEAGREQEALNGLQKMYEAFNPGFEFAYEFVDEDYAEQYAAEQRVATLSSYFAGF
ncbi:MAG: ABC transporter permease, partial [Bacteroidota bacterium]